MQAKAGCVNNRNGMRLLNRFSYSVQLQHIPINACFPSVELHHEEQGLRRDHRRLCTGICCVTARPGPAGVPDTQRPRTESNESASSARLFATVPASRSAVSDARLLLQANPTKQEYYPHLYGISRCQKQMSFVQEGAHKCCATAVA